MVGTQTDNSSFADMSALFHKLDLDSVEGAEAVLTVGVQELLGGEQSARSTAEIKAILIEALDSMDDGDRTEFVKNLWQIGLVRQMASYPSDSLKDQYHSNDLDRYNLDPHFVDKKSQLAHLIQMIESDDLSFTLAQLAQDQDRIDEHQVEEIAEEAVACLSKLRNLDESKQDMMTPPKSIDGRSRARENELLDKKIDARKFNGSAFSKRHSSNNHRHTSAESSFAWSHYLFESGTKMSVGYDAWFGHFDLGQAIVHRCGSRVLELGLEIAGLEQLGLPTTNGILAIEHAEEGERNRSIVHLNGKKACFKNVGIYSKPQSRIIRFPIQILGYQFDQMVLSRGENAQVNLSFCSPKEIHNLILKAI